MKVRLIINPVAVSDASVLYIAQSITFVSTKYALDTAKCNGLDRCQIYML